ncbi:nucleotide exchange factor GrpE [Buchnera aphidicola]|uniref:nucleotide exchange factor GrpE n=1 Tax=Buchnera aphidicola TaxID=9 RepID=UPI002236F867|nr:nucleotide exchange factor GrpE [Buchnera aphidicola]MCW5197736.1 nucleotide exchange factor GrpE [Buchnera aphidicola (Chaitophorus viminalis)]
MNFPKNNKENNVKNKKELNKSFQEVSNNINSKKDEHKKILNKIYKLNKKIFKLQKKIKEFPLRILATIENIKKEKKKEIELIKKNKIIEFFKKFILILENINKINDIFPKLTKKNNSELQGIYLIQQSIIEIIKKNGIQIIGKIGDKYNKNTHEIKNNNFNKIPKEKKPIIKKIIQSGYTLNKIILKKAIVKI